MIARLQVAQRRIPAKHYLLMVTGLLLGSLLALTAAQAEENPYADNYQTQNQGGLHSLQEIVTPTLYSGKNREEDDISMLENGFDLMGSSAFEGLLVPPELALAHGRSIKADSILVYFKKAGNATPSARIEVIKEATKTGKSLTEKEVAAETPKYRYYASYWAKLPPPVLGTHVIKLVPQANLTQDEKQTATTDAEGVKVIAVIHGSAAEKAGVTRGDQLLRINQETVVDASTLSNLVRRLRGQAVTLDIRRQGKPLSLPAQL